MKKYGVEFYEGVLDEEFLKKKFGKLEEGGVLIMDDLMVDGGDDKMVVKIFI